MMHSRASVWTTIVCALLSITFMMPPVSESPPSAVVEAEEPLFADTDPAPLQDNEVYSYLPSSQTVVNGTQTEGDCGSGWGDLNASDDVRCAYREINTGPTTSTASLLPNANGDTVAWTAVNCDEANEWDCVNDDPNDGDGTYLKSATRKVSDSLENLGTVDITGMTVLSVVVTIWCRQMTTSTVGVRTLIKTHGTVYAGASNYNCPNSPTYGSTSASYATNPYSGALWTQAEIDALQAGVRDNDGTSTEVRASEVRVDVTYVSALPSSASLLPNANGDTVAWTAVNCDEANEWDCVNDDPNDGDTTYLKSTAKSKSDSLENLGTVDIAGATVLSVSVTIWCRQMTTSTVGVRTLIKTHGTVYAGASDYNCPNSGTYGSTSTSYAKNPNTGAAWTQAEIDALQAGVRDNDRYTLEVRVSEVRVDVTYVDVSPNYALEAQFTWTDVPTSGLSWVLVAECQRLSPGTENVLVQVGQGGSPPTSWKTAYVCASDTDVTYDTYALNITEILGGNASVRAWDAQPDAPRDTTQGTMAFDVLRIDVTADRNGEGGNEWNYTVDRNTTAPDAPYMPMQEFNGSVFLNNQIQATIGTTGTTIRSPGDLVTYVQSAYWQVETFRATGWVPLQRAGTPLLRTWNTTRLAYAERSETLLLDSMPAVVMITRYIAPMTGSGADSLQLQVELAPMQDLTVKLLWTFDGVTSPAIYRVNRTLLNQTNDEDVGAPIIISATTYYPEEGENLLQFRETDLGMDWEVYVGDALPGYAGLNIDTTKNTPAVSMEFGPFPLTVEYATGENGTSAQVTMLVDPDLGGTPGWAFYDDFSGGSLQGWTPVAGTWTIQPTGAAPSKWVRQSDWTQHNTNLYTQAWQNGGTASYFWSQRITGWSSGAGMHIRATSPTLTNRGNSYVIWQAPCCGTVIYESVADVLYQRALNSNIRPALGVWSQIEVVVNDYVTSIDVYVDGRFALHYVSPSPLPRGHYISLRTNTADSDTYAYMDFDNIRIMDESGNGICGFETSDAFCASSSRDDNLASGLDTWGVTTFRPYQGQRSIWVAQSGTQSTPSQQLLWLDGFENGFPGGTWTVRDGDPENGRDYWDDRSATECGGAGRVYAGMYSVWVADEEEVCRVDYDYHQQSYMYRWMPPSNLQNRVLRYAYWHEEGPGDWWSIIYYLPSQCPANQNGWCFIDYRSGHDDTWRRGESNIPAAASFVGFYFFSDWFQWPWEQDEGVYLDEVSLTATGERPNSEVHQYDNNMDAYLIMPLRLSDSTLYANVRLSFWTWYRIRSPDTLYVYTQSGNVWTLLTSFTGNSVGWVSMSFDIPRTATIVFFRFISDGSGVEEGVYLDNVLVTFMGWTGRRVAGSQVRAIDPSRGVWLAEFAVHGPELFWPYPEYPLQHNEWIANKYTILNSGWQDVTFDELRIGYVTHDGSTGEYAQIGPVTVRAQSFFSYTGYFYIDDSGSWTFWLHYWYRGTEGTPNFGEVTVAVRYKETQNVPNPPPPNGPIDYLEYGYYAELTLTTSWHTDMDPPVNSQSAYQFYLQPNTNVARIDLEVSKCNVADLWIQDPWGNVFDGRPTMLYNARNPQAVAANSRYVHLGVRGGYTYTAFVNVRQRQGSCSYLQLMVRQFALFNPHIEQIAGFLEQPDDEPWAAYPVIYVDSDRIHGDQESINVMIQTPGGQEHPTLFWDVTMEMWLEARDAPHQGQSLGRIVSAEPFTGNLIPPYCAEFNVGIGASPFPFISPGIGVGVTIPLGDGEIGYYQDPFQGHAIRWWRVAGWCSLTYQLPPGGLFGTIYTINWNTDGIHMVGIRVHMAYPEWYWYFDGIQWQEGSYLRTIDWEFMIPIRVDGSTP